MAALRVAVFVDGLALPITTLRVRVTAFFAAVLAVAFLEVLADARETDFAAFRAGALATLFVLTMCFGRAALALSGRRLAAGFGDACRAAERLIPFATGLLM